MSFRMPDKPGLNGHILKLWLAGIGTTCSVKSEGAKTTQTGHTDMNLGFPEPDIRDCNKRPSSEHNVSEFADWTVIMNDTLLWFREVSPIQSAIISVVTY